MTDKEKVMDLSFFMPMIPPTVTHQEKRTTVRNGKPAYYEDSRLKDARAKLTAFLSRNIPPKPFTGGVGLLTKWCYPLSGDHSDGEYKLTKPDTDNSIKLLKDLMTELGFWKDDALVASEITEKFWAATPGIFVRIWELPMNGY